MHWFAHDTLAVLLAMALYPAFIAGHILHFRRRNENALGFIQLPAAFFLYGCVWFALFALIVGPAALRPLECLVGFASVGFLCLGYMQVFSLTCRGFSLRILADIDQHGKLDLDGVAREYSEGRGLNWLMDKRIVSLEKMRLIETRDGAVALTRPRGWWLGIVTGVVKRFLKIAPGG